VDAIIQQYISPIAQWFVSLLTMAEWSAVFLLILSTLFFTHIAKIGWRMSPISGDRRHGLINLTSCLIGLGLGKALWPATGHAPWWIAGPVMGGGGAILVWKLAWPMFSSMLPGVAAKVNMDRRKMELGPPPATAERRKGEMSND
jgi:hypothetical protein